LTAVVSKTISTNEAINATGSSDTAADKFVIVTKVEVT
jgi:hypothetical protein